MMLRAFAHEIRGFVMRTNPAEVEAYLISYGAFKWGGCGAERSSALAARKPCIIAVSLRIICMNTLVQCFHDGDLGSRPLLDRSHVGLHRCRITGEGAMRCAESQITACAFLKMRIETCNPTNVYHYH